MTVYCNVEMSGVNVAERAKAFSSAVNKVANTAYCKKHQNLLNANFKRYIGANLRRSGIYDQDVENTFFVNITNNKVIFGNTNPVVNNRYEYGWEDDSFDDEYLNDYVSMSPRYYIRPAIKKVADDLANVLREDVYKEYEKEAGNLYSEIEWESDIPNKHNYMNKYSGVL